MERIPLFRLPRRENSLQDILTAYESEIWSGGSGEYVRRIEDYFAIYTGMKYSIAVNSGTAACRAALFACLPERIVGARVFVPTYSCGANLAPLFEFNCTPLFVDIDPVTYGMNLVTLSEYAKHKMVRAAILPYMYGEPPMFKDQLVEWFRERKVPIIGDISECFGIERKHIVGDIIVSSLRTEKMLGCGEGGLIATNDPDMFAKIEKFCNRGKPSKAVKYWYTSVGDNLLLPNVSASIAIGQLPTLKEHFAGKLRVAKMYRNSNSFHLMGEWQKVSGDGSCWLNMLVLDDAVQIDRSDLMLALESCGIECRPGFYPLPAYWRNVTGEPYGSFPVAERLWSRGIIFPSPYDLTEEEFNRIEIEVRRIV